MQKNIMPVKSKQCSLFLTADTVFCQVTRCPLLLRKGWVKCSEQISLYSVWPIKYFHSRYPFQYPLFNKTLNCADGQTFLNDFPFTFFMVNDKLCFIVWPLEGHLSTLRPISVPFPWPGGSDVGCVKSKHSSR